MLEQLMTMGQQWPLLVRYLVWFGLIIVALISLYCILLLVFTPIMYLFNRITDRNKSNVTVQADFLLGELTEKISGDSFGEVMEIGSGGARSVYPARFYREQERNSQLTLPIGTKVLIIEFDAQGVALVAKSTTN